MLKTLKRILIYSLIVGTFLNAVPIIVFAETASNAFTKEKETTSDVRKEETVVSDIKKEEIELTVISEITEKRTSNEKHFLMSDGSISAAIYPDDVHYEDNGKFIDIDNTLVRNGNKYITKDNPIKTSFSQESDNNLMEIEYQNHIIKFSIPGVSKVKSDVYEQDLTEVKTFKDYKEFDVNEIYSSFNVKKIKTVEEISQLDNIASEINYKNIIKNIDLNYQLLPNKIKESIIFNTKASIKNQFIFNMDVDDLVAILNEDNTISLLDDKEVIFIIDKPYLYDNLYEISEDIKITLKKIDNTYQMILDLDETWLNSDDRVYPIVLDPTIKTESDKNTMEVVSIRSASVSQTAAFTRVGCGRENFNRSLLKFNLPSLNAGDQVINAELALLNFQYNGAGYTYTPPTRSIAVNVHKVTSNWNESTATWANMSGNYNTKIEDYFIYQYDYNDPYKWNYADITSIVKDWYVNGNNYGIMLKENTEALTSTNEAYFWSKNNTSAWQNYRPSIFITYRNQTGLLDYQTYQVQDAGRAGMVYTNNYNGNLTVVHPDASTPGERLPVSINHVYNTNDKDINIGYGNGWRLNLSQSIRPVVIGGLTYLEYVDEDGTRHYFYGENNVWKDEDGLNLEVTLSNDIYTMTDKDGTKYTFIKRYCYGYIWCLSKILDTSGNSINIEFHDSVNNNSKIGKVTDGAGSQITFTYNGTHDGAVLTGIDDVNGRHYSYWYYSNLNISNVYYPDNKYSLFVYNTNNLLTSIRDIDNFGFDYEYYNYSPYRVKKITERAKDYSIGNEININYGEYVTRINDYKGNQTNYLFNSFGQTTSITDGVNDLNNTYGKSYTYDNSTHKKANRLLLETDLIKSTNNLVMNGSGDFTDTSWQFSNWGTGTEACLYSSSDGYFGSKSFRCTASTNVSRPVGVQSLYLTKGKMYTLSAWIKSTGATKESVIFQLSYNTTNNQSVFTSLSKIESIGSWNRYEISFDYGVDAATPLYVTMGIKGSVSAGTIYFDGIQLESGEISNINNLLQNGNFTFSDMYWNKSNLNSNDIVTNNSFKIIGLSGNYKSLYQNIYISGNQNDIFTYSGLVKTNGVPINLPASSKRTEISVNIMCNNGTNYWVGKHIDSSTNDWQYVSDKFITTCAYYRMDYYIAFHNNANDAYFSNLGLYKDLSGNSYTYDVNGNLISSKDNANQNNTFNYDSKNQLVSMVKPNGASYTYTYDNNIKNRLLKATNQGGINYNFGYNSYGQNTALQVKDASSSKYIESSQTFSSDGKYVTSVTDQQGNIVINNYNTYTGTIANTTDQNNNTTYYDYDYMDKLIYTSKINTANNYTYTNDYLNTIKHNGITYSFVYDKYNNINQVKLNNQSLITNNYESRNGNLSSSTYGNSQSIAYGYDNFNRLVYKQKTNGALSYYYDNSSNLALTFDNSIGEEKTYSYDITNRLTNIKQNLYNSVFNIKYNYNKYSIINKVSYEKDSTLREVFYDYNTDNNLTSTLYGNNSVNYTYDSLNRLNTKKINNTYQTVYNYKNINTNKTTMLLESIINGNNTISYTYDAVGNILTIKEGTTLVNEYTYDSLNQLINDKNYKSNIEEVYTYDNGGNILTKKTYELNTDSLTASVNYQYTNTNWKDQLTSIDNKAIFYDNIGNPLTYGSISYTWQNGRELATYKDTSKGLNISYKYNDAGIRIEKNVNGDVITKYYLEGSNIIYEQRGNDLLYYIYDDYGVIGFTYNGATYYYVKNGQNDVIQILNSSYQLVANYKYDAWGNTISITDINGEEVTTDNLSSDNYIAYMNAIRYRGYYFDIETNLYYLNSRYYSSEFGRFINADTTDVLSYDHENVIQYNLYAYAFNNPINYVDHDGDFGIALGIAGLALIGGAILSIPIVAPMLAKLVTPVVSHAVNLFNSSPIMNPMNNRPNKNNKTPQKRSLKTVGNSTRANQIAKQFGYKDAHAFKRAFVKNISQYDMHYDTKTGEIILKAIKGGAEIATGLFR